MAGWDPSKVVDLRKKSVACNRYVRFIGALYCTSGLKFEGFPRHDKQLVPRTNNLRWREPRNQAEMFGVDHQVVDLAQILILAIDHRPRSERLKTAPRPVVSSATAEDQKQYDYYQDKFHIITTSSGWNELSDIILEHVLCQTGWETSPLHFCKYI